jgi:hypothetical protein
MFYEPVQAERYFEKGRRYYEIEWKNFAKVVEAFELRIRGWYIDPAELLIRQSGHYSFTTIAVTCLLIDALSQYRYGVLCSEGRHFKQFVRDFLPSYNGTLPAPIWHHDHKNATTGRKLTHYADVLWHGFRCGILHEAHAPLYCGILPGVSPPLFEPANHARYASGAHSSVTGADCPVVLIYPEHLFMEGKTLFYDYLNDLLDKASRHDKLRDDFKRKFTESFGVDLSISALP